MRTTERKKQYNKEYAQQHRDSICKRQAAWYQKNRDALRRKSKAYHRQHRDVILQQQASYRQQNPELVRQRRVDYFRQNCELLRQRTKNRLKTDLNFRLRYYLRNRLRIALYNQLARKRGSSVQDLGCSMAQFIEYIADQFKPNMSWENYGEWHIDHVRPLASFDLSDQEQLRVAVHYSNLQPLWAMENFRKHAKLEQCRA